jgi:hypothetical protein
MAVFEGLLCDTRPNPYDAIYVNLEEATRLQKQHIKGFYEKEIEALFKAIDEDLEQLRDIRATWNSHEAQAMRGLISRTVSEATQMLEPLEGKLKETGIDVEAVKAQLSE